MLTVVGNLKGGTGKSTVAFNLAVWLAHDDAGVQAFDLDPQATLTDVCEVRSEDGYDPSVEVTSDVALLQQMVENKARKPIIADVSVGNMPDMHIAMSLADRVVVPIQPSQADIWSTQRFLKIIKEHANARTQVLGFINRADTHVAVRETDEAEEALGMLKGIKAMDVRLYQRTAYRRSFSEGLAVFELDPMGKASREMKRLAQLLDKL